MNRRLFLSTAIAVPAEPTVRRVYSFIWSNPLFTERGFYAMEPGDGRLLFHPGLSSYDVYEGMVVVDTRTMEEFRLVTAQEAEHG